MKRKFFTTTLVLCILAIVCYVGVSVYAALTKTATETVGDAWQAVTAATLVVGDAVDVSASYSSVLCVELGYIEAGDTSGATFIVEISYDTENWMELTSWVSVVDASVALDKINDASSTAGDTTVVLDDGATDEFDVVGRVWFLYDPNTIANSELVRTKSVSTNTITLCDPTTHNHPDNMIVYDRGETKLVALPMATRQVRVLCYNSDADIDCAFQYSVLKVTAIQ